MFKFEIKDNCLYIKILFIKIRLTLSIEKFLIKNSAFLIRILDCILPKNKNKTVAHLMEKHENKMFTFTDYIEKQNPKMKITYVSDEKENIVNNKIFYVYSFKAICEMLTSKYVIILQNEFFLNYYKSKRHTYINLWHGMPIKTIGFSRETKNKNGKKCCKYIGDNFKCFATSDLFKQLLISCFMVEYDNVYTTGLPVTDRIFDSSNNTVVENYFKFKNYKKTLLYLPTYKTKYGDMDSQIEAEYNNLFYFDDFQDNKFSEFLEKDNILFVMKPHPHDEEFYRNNPWALPKSDHFKIIYDKDLKENGFDLYDMFKYVDLMISDFSSVTIDYLILNRPVIYLDNLSEDYANVRGMILEDNYGILMPGHKVKTYQELEEKIIDSLTVDSSRELREKTLPLLHKYCDDKASERIFDIMTRM